MGHEKGTLVIIAMTLTTASQFS